MSSTPVSRWIRIGWALVIVAGSLQPGCSSRRAVAYEVRLHPTGLAAGEGVTILLHQYQSCRESEEKECEARSHQRRKEIRFEGCMERAMRRERRDLRIVPAAKFRRTAFQGMEYRDEPRAPEALLQFLSAPGVRERIAPLKVRYLVVVGASTRRFNGQRSLEGLDEADGMWGIGSEWQRLSQGNAVVLDLEAARESGSLNANSNGKAGILFPFLWVLPLPPVGWSSPTEERACNAPGRAAANFIAGPGEQGGK
jgi:hypothetical protein